MPDEFQYDVLLNHSAKDKAVVREIAKRLKEAGLRLWFDEWEIKPGDSIPSKIEEGLERSRVLVLCMSANAFGSDWAQLEAGTFRFRDPLNKERRFIPLRLDDAPIKGSLAQFLYINWQPADREQECSKLLDACRNPATWPQVQSDEHANANMPDDKGSETYGGGVRRLSKIRLLTLIALVAFACVLVWVSNQKKSSTVKTTSTSTPEAVTPQEIKSASENQKPAVDQIPGTQFTHADAYKLFPFGWVVFRFQGDKLDKLVYEPDPAGKIKITWKEIEIVPDFSTGEVSFQFVGLDVFRLENGKKQVIIDIDKGVYFRTFAPLKTGTFVLFQMGLPPNEPQLSVGTLNDDQRSPVFLAGFRIGVPNNR